MIRTVLLNTGSSPNIEYSWIWDKYSLFTDGPYITVYTVYASAQKAAREAYAHYTGRPNKQKNKLLIQTGRGKRQGEQTITCAVQVQVETQSTQSTDR